MVALLKAGRGKSHGDASMLACHVSLGAETDVCNIGRKHNSIAVMERFKM